MNGTPFLIAIAATSIVVVGFALRHVIRLYECSLKNRQRPTYPPDTVALIVNDGNTTYDYPGLDRSRRARRGSKTSIERSLE